MTSFDGSFLRPPTVELCLMKLPKAVSEAEQKGQLSGSTACHQACDEWACNRSDIGFYTERKLHWKSQCTVLAKALSVHTIIHLLNRRQNKEMIHSAFSSWEFFKISDFYITFISSWQCLTYLVYLSSKSALQLVGHHLPILYLKKRAEAWSIAEDWTGVVRTATKVRTSQNCTWWTRL